MSSRSLNQIVKELLSAGEDHPQLNSVQFEPPVDSLDNGDIRYPAFLFNYNGARKENLGGATVLSYRFTAWVYDNMHKEADNERDVWSDTTAIACDLISYMDDIDRDYRLVDNIEIQALSQEREDLLSGVRFDFTLQVPFPSACEIPIEPGGYILTEEGAPIITEDESYLTVE